MNEIMGGGFFVAAAGDAVQGRGRRRGREHSRERQIRDSEPTHISNFYYDYYLVLFPPAMRDGGATDGNRERVAR